MVWKEANGEHFFLSVLEMEHRALCMLGKHSATKLHP
jgi:hypothetical protein